MQNGRTTISGIGDVPRCQVCGRLKEKIEDGIDVVVYDCCDGVSVRPKRHTDCLIQEKVLGYQHG